MGEGREAASGLRGVKVCGGAAARRQEAQWSGDALRCPRRGKELMDTSFFLWLIGWSLVAFALYVIDKALAKLDAWRIPELALLGLMLIGGWPGAGLAMLLVRHKTRHGSFWLVLGLSALGWGVLLWQRERAAPLVWP